MTEFEITPEDYQRADSELVRIQATSEGSPFAVMVMAARNAIAQRNAIARQVNQEPAKEPVPVS